MAGEGGCAIDGSRAYFGVDARSKSPTTLKLDEAVRIHLQPEFGRRIDAVTDEILVDIRAARYVTLDGGEYDWCALWPRYPHLMRDAGLVFPQGVPGVSVLTNEGIELYKRLEREQP